MEKKSNNNIIVRKDGMEYVGYISDVKSHVIKEVQSMLNGWELVAENDTLIRDTEKLMYLAKDLIGYENADTTLIKATKDADSGYWYVNIMY